MGNVAISLETKGYFYSSKYGTVNTAIFIPEYEYLAEYYCSKHGYRYGTYEEFKQLFPYRINSDRYRSSDTHYYGMKL